MRNFSTAKKSLSMRLFKSREIFGSGLWKLLKGAKHLDDATFAKLEELLIGADLGVLTTDKILAKMKPQKMSAEADFYQFAKTELGGLLMPAKPLEMNANGVFVILVVGVNGVGKTTTVAKIANRHKAAGKSVMLAACDTFRAGAVEQIKIWGGRLDIPVVAQNIGADSAAVAFDAYQSARAKNMNCLIIDTAGRLHTQDDLMRELQKIVRVLKKSDPDAPHEKMLVIDGNSGQNAHRQAEVFQRTIGIDSLAVTKLDGSAKGGILFGISDALKLPVRYIGVGEGMDDLRDFEPQEFINALFSE